MSATTISVPIVIPALYAVPALAAAGAATAGIGMAAAAYYTSKKLKADYQCALAEFSARATAASHERTAWSAKQEGKMARAAELAELVAGKSSAEASVVFLQASIAEALKWSDKPATADLHARAGELMDKLEAAEKPDELAEEVLKLTAELHARLSELAATEEHAPAIGEVFASVRAEIESIRGAEKEDLLAQLSRLEELSAAEKSVALQGLDNVRMKATRLIEADLKRDRDRVRRRELAAESVAMLQAVSQVPNAPEAGEAMATLERISAAFAAPEPPTLVALESFHAKAKTLFDTCDTRLDLATRSAVVTDSVAETLMEMGYKVSQVPSENSTGCLVPVNESTGMVVSVDQAGQLRTEMVAFDQGAIHPDGATQDKVCSIVDDILAGLRKRDIEVKEKSRKMVKTHEAIRVVERPEEAQTPVGAAKPKERVVT
ncbi:MAG: hypothetical protein QOJ65_772 [Fimbriimonadaceae bacterium]|jgi:hypothetical protein|nr:hypothetical protein [Fimbriimonadaceae bacterium]